MITKDIYPLTIIKDRYCGTYSGGIYTAWNKDFDEISEAVSADDVSCAKYFDTCREVGIVYGRGDTIEEAVDDLIKKMKMEKSYE